MGALDLILGGFALLLVGFMLGHMLGKKEAKTRTQLEAHYRAIMKMRDDLRGQD